MKREATPRGAPVYGKLQRRLTLAGVLGAALILILMTAVSLAVSLYYFSGQAGENFHNDMTNVIFYLQGRQVIDQTWLARTEANTGLLIRIDDEKGQSFAFTAQDPLRDEVTQEAKRVAEERFSLSYQQPQPLGEEPFMIWYTIEAAGRRWRAGVTLVPYGNSVLTVTMAKSMAEEMAVMRNLVAAFSVSVAAAGALLAVFLWRFTGRALDPAKKAYDRQSYFISAVSHELRTPLSVIRMSANSIRTLPEKTDQYAGKIERESAHMGRLITDMLTLAGDGGDWQLQTAPTPVSPLLRDACERFTPRAREKGIALACKDALGDKTAKIDEGRVRQVLDILLDNAVSYTPGGGRIEAAGEISQNRLVLTVSDSGPGIPKEERAHIFERFYRGDAARAEKGHFGLGLSIAGDILRRHGGTLSLEPSPLGGASFRVSLPLRPQAGAAIPKVSD